MWFCICVSGMFYSVVVVGSRLVLNSMWLVCLVIWIWWKVVR